MRTPQDTIINYTNSENFQKILKRPSNNIFEDSINPFNANKDSNNSFSNPP